MVEYGTRDVYFAFQKLFTLKWIKNIDFEIRISDDLSDADAAIALVHEMTHAYQICWGDERHIIQTDEWLFVLETEAYHQQMLFAIETGIVTDGTRKFVKQMGGQDQVDNDAIRRFVQDRYIDKVDADKRIDVKTTRQDVKDLTFNDGR